MIVATSIEELGTPTADGAEGLLRLGSGAESVQEPVTWNASAHAWLGRPKPSMMFHDTVGMVRFGGANETTYISAIEPEPNVAFSFQIHPITHADLLWEAGFRVQEHLSAFINMPGPTDDGYVIMNWYAWNEGDPIFAPPPNEQGIRLNALIGDDRFHFCTTGWKNSTLPQPDGKTLYADLYGNSSTGAVFKVRHLRAFHRWIGLGTGGGTFTPDTGAQSHAATALPPVTANLLGYWSADNVPVANGATVAELPDTSARNIHLYQPDDAKRPTLSKTGLNGHAFLAFDGVDDFLSNWNSGAAWPNITQMVLPGAYTVFLVARQRNLGGATQVWLDQGSILYRGNGTDVNFYPGSGSDIVYDRGSAWPSPWACYSVVANGAGASSVWENEVVKLTGQNAAVGMGHPTLGANSSGNFPAHVDIAGMVLYQGALSDANRLAVIRWLNGTYNLY
jgi:hypothetical protein